MRSAYHRVILGEKVKHFVTTKKMQSRGENSEIFYCKTIRVFAMFDDMIPL